MTEKRYSLAVILVVAAVAIGLAIVALSGGVFVGYQMGKAAGRAQARAELPGADLDDLRPFLEGFGPRGEHLFPRGEGMFPPGELPEGFEGFEATERPLLGVTFQVITEELAEAEDLSENSGALVVEVLSGGPAAEAGVEEDDIILEVDGIPVDEAHPLPELINSYEPGDEIELTIVRAGDELLIAVELGARRIGGAFRGDSIESLEELMPLLGQEGLFLGEAFPEGLPEGFLEELLEQLPEGSGFRLECGPDGCEFIEGDS